MKREGNLLRVKSLTRVPNDYVPGTTPEQHTWWTSLTDGQRKFVVSLSLVLGVSVLALIAFYFINRKIQSVRAKKEQTQSFGKDKYATWAKQFKNAFDNDGWWGTKVPLVRQTMREIPSKEDFEKVVQSYKVMNKGANMIARMTSELTTLEYEEMLAIKNGKPEKSKGSENVRLYDPPGWARRFHAAIYYTWIGFLPGTDEDAVKAVLQEMKTQKAFNDTQKAYRSIYGESLWYALDKDLDWSFDWQTIVKKKPKGY